MLQFLGAEDGAWTGGLSMSRGGQHHHHRPDGGRVRAGRDPAVPGSGSPGKGWSSMTAVGSPRGDEVGRVKVGPAESYPEGSWTVAAP